MHSGQRTRNREAKDRRWLPTPDDTNTLDPENKQHSKSCLSQEDCSADSGCRCAPDKCLPLSSNWGTLIHSSVANAAAIIVAAVKLYSQCSESRCLLNSNGTVDIPTTPYTPMPNLSRPELTCPCSCTCVYKACRLSN